MEKRNYKYFAIERARRTTKDSAYIKRLEDELSLAKQLLAEKDKEIALRDDLLKKKYPLGEKRAIVRQYTPIHSKK